MGRPQHGQPINLLNDDTSACAENMKENNNLVALAIDPLSSEILIIYYLTQIGGSFLMKDKKLVVPNGFGPLATVIRFKSAENLFSCVLDVEISTKADMFKFKTAVEFSKLTVNSKTFERFRNVLLLPPFIVIVILAIPSLSPNEWAAIIKAVQVT